MNPGGGNVMTDPQKVTRLIIRAALKELQQKKYYKSFEELKTDLEHDLIEEGFSLDDDDRHKIGQIVDEEGYTGRFAIDDIIRRKFKNRKLWPVISIAVALLIFIITSAAGGLIEYFVQKPLNSNPSPAANPGTAIIAAFFQLPTKVEGETLDFKVTIQNMLKNEALKDLILFASADDVVKKFTINQLPPDGKTIIDARIDVKDVKKARFDFNAYIIGAKVSFRSEPVSVEKSARIAYNEDTVDRKDKFRDTVAQVSGENSGTGSFIPARSTMQNPSAGSCNTQKHISAGMGGGSSSMIKTGAKPENSLIFSNQNPDGKVNFSAMSTDLLLEEAIQTWSNVGGGEHKEKIELIKTLAESGNEKAKKFLKDMKLK